MKSLSLILIFCLLLLLCCEKNNAVKYPELNQAKSFVQYLTSKRFLSRSAFKHVYPEKKPSQFVNYLFSTIGSAEWVVTGDPFEEEQMRSIRIPIPPQVFL